ncbi:MAG TPA: D-alanyl-D-alanine carboxypeptidase family protein [Thauera sp.]|uniref:D-alanyl-D-alanine carboxypeptidase family protein n=1 Tax=Thauera sp. TaxID=1905334 RepID=UPI000FA000DE|nr:D-alanyl-D-alanine carboxypeptidase family protein [Thauera sp.]RTL28764.1 MAG: D-alanyl-D-alanine carboxypeptidase [Rhodocyclaceae bacterium]MCB1944337.1 D-alanyl-D-alanine carboxypeptidase [Thauera sp.]MCP5225874.1 D-alanyl-D-alanine carboxypeptidase [Thauera sp.]HPE03400.1 D-alanyl-D-alanine carboxypeptidase family protein [Thauera sp.]HRV76620.1 D-alanyl-D-alanine carboxypeptidase family protein [Thauera sp.]
MRFLIAVLVSLFSLSALAQTVPPPALAAKAWALVDHATAQVLAEKDADARIEPASLTKLMTAYITFSKLKEGTLKPDQVVPVSTKAWRMEGSRMFIEPNKPVSVDELIRGVIVQSGNDACVALAETIAGSEEAFAALMNREAQRLGMTNTHFTNSTGLPDPQLYTSARDLALLASAIIRDFPEYYSLYSLKEFTYNGIKQPNRNRLLYMDPSVDGMKTGHTSSAGYCLVSTARRGERRLISVVLGAASDTVRAQESLKLLNFGYQFFETVKLYSADEALSKFRVWKGKLNELPVGFLNDFALTVPKEAANKIQVSLESRQPLVAPLQRGQEVGTLTVAIDGKPLGQYPVVALQDAEVAGFFGRLWDAIVMFFKSL